MVVLFHLINASPSNLGSSELSFLSTLLIPRMGIFCWSISFSRCCVSSIFFNHFSTLARIHRLNACWNILQSTLHTVWCAVCMLVRLCDCCSEIPYVISCAPRFARLIHRDRTTFVRRPVRPSYMERIEDIRRVFSNSGSRADITLEFHSFIIPAPARPASNDLLLALGLKKCSGSL